MSYRDCINTKIGANHKRKADAERMLDQFDARVKDLQDNGMDAATAEVTVGSEFRTRREDENLWAKKRRVQDARVQLKQTDRIMKSAKPSEELQKTFGEMERVSNGYLAHFHAITVKFLDEYELKAAGLYRKKAGLDNILKELYGEGSGDRAAKAMADAFREMYGAASKISRANGVNMVNDPKYHAPQKHDIGKMSNAGADAWVKDHMGKDVLDWDEMRKFNDGINAPKTDAEKEAVLRKVYKTIVTGGLDKATFDYKADMSVSARLTQKRYLRYASPKSWTSMQSKYGVGTLADQLIEGMGTMSRDLAQLQVLGPNPGVTKRRLESAVQVRTNALLEQPGLSIKEQKKLTVDMTRGIAVADDIYGLVTGRNSQLDDNFAAVVLSAVRNLLPGALLGKAVISAVPGDLVTMKHASFFAGHKNMSPVKQYAKLLNPANKSDRDFAKRSGVIMELAMSSLAASERFGGDPLGPKWARRITDTALRITGLSKHTEVARWATSMELMGSYADMSKTSFDKLPFKERMERFGITKEDWDVLRSNELADHNGSKFLRPRDLLLRDDLDPTQANEVFAKFSQYQFDFLELAVPTASVEARAALIGGTRAGTIPGEIARATAMFKNFPMTIMMRHWGEGMAAASKKDKLLYFSTFIAGLTAAGAVSEQLHAITKGENLRNMNPFENPLFWADALARGGGLSIFADFLTSDANRYGGGFFSTLLGPTAQLADDTSKMSLGSVQKLLKGEDTALIKSFAENARRYTPGSHTWYLDRAITAAFGEFILQGVDPQYHQKAQKKMNNLWKEEKGSYWWSPKSALPESAPDFSTAFGEQ